MQYFSKAIKKAKRYIAAALITLTMAGCGSGGGGGSVANTAANTSCKLPTNYSGQVSFDYNEIKKLYDDGHVGKMIGKSNTDKVGRFIDDRFKSDATLKFYGGLNDFKISVSRGEALAHVKDNNGADYSLPLSGLTSNEADTSAAYLTVLTNGDGRIVCADSDLGTSVTSRLLGDNQ